MWEVREPATIIQAAERTAEAGNYAAAENLLREAARLQEESLGPRHPDLANTLNNLAIVCEMTGKPDDAEQYFRRAASIARTSIDPDHPFVATSQKNLEDFYRARGKQVETPTPAPAPVAAPAPAPAPAAESPAPARTENISPEPEDRQLPANTLFHRVALGALGPIAMLMVILAAGLPRLGAPELIVPSRAVASDVSPDLAPAQVPALVATTPAPDAATAADSANREENAAAPAATPARPEVIRASLCGDLDDWSCDPADRPIPQGPLFLYTPIKAASATTIQHRWYQDDRLIQTVKLRVQPNRTAGYRTYSRYVMTGDSAGSWRIELRGEDEALLHEERFTVR